LTKRAPNDNIGCLKITFKEKKMNFFKNQKVRTWASIIALLTAIVCSVSLTIAWSGWYLGGLIVSAIFLIWINLKQN